MPQTDRTLQNAHTYTAAQEQAMLATARSARGVPDMTRTTKLAALAVVVLLVAFVAELVLFVRYMDVNRDEGWYLLAGRLVYEGEVPYRDFSYFQGPLLPYIFGLPQQLFGPGILAGRIFVAVLGAGSAALVTLIAYRLGGWVASAVALAIACTNVSFIIASSTARAEGVVVPLLLLVPLLMMRFPSGLPGFVLPPLLVLVVAAMRVVYLPSVLIFAALAWWYARPTRGQTALGILVLAAALLALFVPFAVLDLDRAWFGMYLSQAARTGQFVVAERPLGLTLADRVGALHFTASSYAVVFLSGVFLATLVVQSYLRGWRPRRGGMLQDPLTASGVLVVMAAALWAPFVLSLEFQELRYFVPSFALLAIAAGAACAAHRSGALDDRASLLAPLVAIILIADVALGASAMHLVMTVHNPGLEETGRVAAYLRSVAPKDGRIATFDPVLVVESRLDVMDRMEMGSFSYWPHLTTEDAAKFGVFNRETIVRAMLDPSVSVIVIDSSELAVLEEINPGDIAPGATEAPFRVLPELQPAFAIATTFPDYGRFNQTIYVLLRR